MEVRNLVDSCNKKQVASPFKRSVRYFFLDDEKLLILGLANSRDVFLATVTGLQDTRINDLIIKNALIMNVEEVTDVENVASQINTTYESLLYVYNKQIEINDDYGKFIIDELNRVKEKANNVDIVTERKLQDFLIRSFNRTDDPKKDFASFQSIIQQVRELKYILLSDDETLKLTYVELKKSCNEIINRFKKVMK